MTGKATVSGRGRKPKPNKEKALSGSRNVNKNAVEFESMTNVEPPEWLTPLARQMWETLCPQLCSKKILAVTDLHNLEAFCSSYAMWRTAQEEVRLYGLTIEQPNGNKTKNPACTVINEALRQIAIFGGNLGLDPASRGRLIGGGNEENTNPFGKF